MKLGTKFLLVSIVGLIIAISSLFFLTTYSFRSNLDEQIVHDSDNELTLATRSFQANQNVLNTLSDSLKSNYLNLSRSVREVLEAEPDLSSEALSALASEINVTEIHIVDEDGILAFSNFEDLIGYDFASSEQSAVFLEGIENNQFELAQDPAPRGTDNQYFMYVGVSRLDQPGVVQIGMEPTEYQNLVDSFDLQDLVENHRFSDTGHIFITDQNGEIIAHPNVERIGSSVNEQYDKAALQTTSEGQFNEGDRFIQYVSDQSGYTFFAEVDRNDYYSQLYDLQQRMILFGVIALLIVGLLIHFLSRKVITKPIEQVIGKINKVANGDLSVTFESKRKDEIGKLSSHMHSMIQQLKGLMNEISESSMLVAGTSEQLSASGHEIFRSSEEVTHSVKVIASHIDHQFSEIQTCSTLTSELSDRMAKMTESIETISENASASSESSIKGKEIIQGTSEQMKQMIEQVVHASKVIRELNNKTNQIEEVISIISNISGQTNLLALNASIEAARAGEKGKGFAVVASEVRKLAEETVASTSQIDSIILKIKSESTEAVKIMEQTNVSVQNSADLVTKAGDSFSTIHLSIDQIADQLQDISSYIQQNKEQAKTIDHKMLTLSEASEKIVESVQTISTVTSEHSSTIEDISSATDSLTKMAEKLSGETEKYKVND